MTPVIHFQRRLFHGFTGHNPFLQLLVKNDTGRIQILFSTPHRQHEMPEYIFGNIFSPRHCLSRLKCPTYILQQKVSPRKRYINQRRIGVKKHQRLPLFNTHWRIKHGKQIPRIIFQHFFLFLEIPFHHFPVIRICHKMLFLTCT